MGTRSVPIGPRALVALTWNEPRRMTQVQHLRYHAYKSPDGSKAVFIDEHPSDETGAAFDELMSKAGHHKRLMGASELERVFVTGGHGEQTRQILAQFGVEIYRTV